MADMNFGVNLLPVTTATYSIGSSSKKWQINGVSDPQLTDTTYSSESEEQNGTDVSLVTTGEKYIWNHKTSNVGTITEILLNGTSLTASGAANIPAASTNAYGVTKLSDSTSTTSSVLAATPTAVKAAYDLADSKISFSQLIVASGTQNLGDVSTSGGNVTVNFTPTLANNNYIVLINTQVATLTVGIQSKLTNSFKIYYRSISGTLTTGTTVTWAILKL